MPIHADSDGPEEYETFQIEPGDPQGGAGLGKKNEVVSILPDGAPGGQFAVYQTYGDEAAPAEVVVYRNFYSEGAVSVTVTPVAGSADAGDDFDASPVTLHWADGDSEPKVALIGIVDDDEPEFAENLTIQLSQPTGGAILGPSASAQLSINFNDTQNTSGGGGSTGWLSLLLLGLATLLRSLRSSARPVIR